MLWNTNPKIKQQSKHKCVLTGVSAILTNLWHMIFITYDNCNWVPSVKRGLSEFSKQGSDWLNER